MNYRALIAALGLAAMAPAWSEYNEAAYEVEAELMQLPAGIAGSVIVRECDSCPQYTHRVTATTEYRFNGTQTSLERLRTLLPTAVAQEGVFVVAYDIETRNVAFIALDL